MVRDGSAPSHTPQTQVVTDLVLAIFRANGALIASGDALVADLGLTSARWQVLGAVTLAGRPLTVAQAARRMGLSRQAVQRVANDLADVGLVVYTDNPDHKRAKLITLTPEGEAAYGAADRRWMAWARGLGEGFDQADLARAAEIVRTIAARAETGGEIGG
ncbi:MAG: MarR family winged helix-turn-helix transcriptional regulator [Salinarimonas sp.]